MIINTCGFIEDAKREAIETILEVAEYKKAGIISAIVVTGCLAERYQDEIIKEIPEVDSVIGIGADNDIVKVCHKALLGVRTSFYPDKKYLLLEGDRMLSTPKHWAYLKISDGCDNRCSYDNNCHKSNHNCTQYSKHLTECITFRYLKVHDFCKLCINFIVKLI